MGLATMPNSLEHIQDTPTAPSLQTSLICILDSIHASHTCTAVCIDTIIHYITHTMLLCCLSACFALIKHFRVHIEAVL